MELLANIETLNNNVFRDTKIVSRETGLEFESDSGLCLHHIARSKTFLGLPFWNNLEPPLCETCSLKWTDFVTVGLFGKVNNAEWANTLWNPIKGQAGWQCYLILSAHFCPLQRWRIKGTGHKQFAHVHVASMRQRTPRSRAVQHQSHLFTAPNKGHSKRTFTFWGRHKFGLRRCGLYLVCLPAQKITSLVWSHGLFQGCHVIHHHHSSTPPPPFQESSEECAKRKRNPRNLLLALTLNLLLWRPSCKEVFIPL